jgi:integrase
MTVEVNVNDLTDEPAYRPIPWDRFVLSLLADYQPPLRSAAALRQMTHAMGRVSCLIAPDRPGPLVRTTEDMKPIVLARLIQSCPPRSSPHTVRALLRCFRVACNIAVDHGHLKVSPFRRNKIGNLVRAPRPTGRRHLSAAEIRTLLDLVAADVARTKGWPQWKFRRLQALVSVVAYCGLRRGEALGLRVQDIDLGARLIHVRPHAGRGLKTDRSEASVPMPEALVPILADWLAHRNDAPPAFRMPAALQWLFPNCRRRGPWRDGTAGDKPLSMLKAAAVRAGIGGDVNFQMLRRSLCTHLRTRFGASRDLAAQILRHSPAVADAFYVQDDEDNLRAAVAKVDF